MQAPHGQLHLGHSCFEALTTAPLCCPNTVDGDFHIHVLHAGQIPVFSTFKDFNKFDQVEMVLIERRQNTPWTGHDYLKGLFNFELNC